MLTVAYTSVNGCGRSSDVAGTDGLNGGLGSGGGNGSGSGQGLGGWGFVPCAQINESATLVPVNMFITIDKSGSMEDDDKWVMASSAFSAFFDDPEAGGLSLALRLWPTAGCDHETCNIDACGTPQVPLGVLSDPDHRQALKDLLNGTTPGGWTPMSAALNGAIQWSRNHLQSVEGEEKVVIILVTDGDPIGCDPECCDVDGCDECTINKDCLDISCAVHKVAGIAAEAFIDDGVRTYTVGLEGSSEADMDLIAEAGGTTTGFFVSNSGDAEAALVATLKEIQSQAVPCSFALPQPDNPGDELNLDLVGIRYKSGSAGGESFLPQVDGASACTDAGGFYYNNPDYPTMATLCPASCGIVQADGEAVIDFALGCKCESDADCPAGLICIDGACVDPGLMGAPCDTDEDCPHGFSCIGDQCSDGRIIVGPNEAVQGGAFSCAVGQPDASSRRSGLLLVVMMCIALGVARRREQRR